MATGGFSSRSGSIGAYGSPYIEWVCTVFMLLASFNFTLIWRFLRGRGADIARNSEARAYGFIFLVSAAVISLSLSLGSPGPALHTNIRQAFFHTASIVSSTGFSAADYSFWPPLAQAALFLLMFTGGCSGSTSGGVKVIRHVVLFKQMKNEMNRLLCPRGVFSIQLDGKAGQKSVVYGTAGFVFAYLALVMAAALFVSFSGLDPFSSLNAALITMGNIGLGFGKFGPGGSLGDMPAWVKWGLGFVMIAGRLEIWTALVFFCREYRRRR
jgi:trk system potassium uptake protein TrkH